MIALGQDPRADAAKSSRSVPSRKRPEKVRKSFLRLEFIAVNPHPKIGGEKLLAGKSNYFIGSDPTKWKRNVPHYATVRYSDLYPGIDLIVHDAKDGTEYDLCAAPGVDPSQIQLGIRGARTAKLNRSGELVLDTPNGSVVGHAPVLYQDIDGIRKSVAGGYALNDSFKVGFKVGAYDHSKPLVIDPTILPSYSTYLGGSGTDTGTGIAVDSNGSAYVTGNTTSTDFPVSQGAYQTTFQNAAGATLNTDVFITKLSPDGTSLVYSTYLSGMAGSRASGIAVDANGSAYIVGLQGGGDFPYTAGSYQGSGLGQDFVTKLSPDGSELIYSASLGTTANNGITVDSMGNAYVASTANSPTGSPSSEAQVAKLNPDGSGLVYQAALPPPGDLYGNPLPAIANGIVIDALGDAFIAGGYDYKPTPGDPRPSCPGSIVWKLSPDGSTALYTNTQDTACQDSPYRTGPATSIAIDSSGNAYAVQAGNIMVLDPNGSMIARYGVEGVIDAVAIDHSGILSFTGATSSIEFTNYTTADAFQNQLPGQQSAFITRIDAGGTTLLYSTYFGGSYIDGGNAIALDSQGNGYITGYTTSSDFPHTVDAFQGSLDGNQNAFVAKFEFPVVPTPTPTATETATPVPTITPTPRKTSAPLPTRTPDGTATATVTQTATPLPTPAVPPSETPAPVGPRALSVLPRGISFGPMRVDRSKVATIRVRNMDKAPVTIEQMQYSGNYEFTWNSNCGQVIAAGARCEIRVNFSPTTTQGASGSISVFSNTPFSPQTVLLKGR